MFSPPLRGGSPLPLDGAAALHYAVCTMHRSWIEIDLNTLADNISSARAALRRETEIMFVVKANAYGHGLGPITQHAVEAGVRWFAVAYLHEALMVRKHATAADILIMGAVEPEDIPVLLEHRITSIVVSEEHGQRLAEAAREHRVVLPVHLKIDTGMGRLGVPWADAAAIFRSLDTMGGLEIRGLCSHFATVEPGQPERAGVQIQRFEDAVRNIEGASGSRLFKHISSSRAILYHEEWDLDAVRPGIALYGYGTDDTSMRFKTRPLLQWKTSVIQVKSVPAGFPVGYYSTYVTREPTDIAVIAVGYADGYHRALSNRGHVLIHGCRRPVVGRVSMNWVTVDAGRDHDVQAGDEVVLMGEQGRQTIWADELAQICRTIPYEILVGIDPMAVRKYE